MIDIAILKVGDVLKDSNTIYIITEKGFEYFNIPKFNSVHRRLNADLYLKLLNIKIPQISKNKEYFIDDETFFIKLFESLAAPSQDESGLY